ncbi:unnamed protein product [Blepharisma stoltei]|uniref:WD40 repeat-like protein n=1 Tax=Blepharisma stoltei TaxID=1481888 RepID=A0AAU9JLF4_9CILI|nr:unnamed protein product [Blepharisma stoltei]
MEINTIAEYRKKYHEKLNEGISDLHKIAEIPTTSPSYTVKYSHGDQTMLAASDESGEVYIISIAGDSSVSISSQFRAHHNSIFDTSWSFDDTKLLTASGDLTGMVWDLERKESETLVGHGGSIKCIKSVPNTREVYATAARDGFIYFWDARCPGKINENRTEHEPVGFITGKHKETGKKNRIQQGSTIGFTGIEFLGNHLIASVEQNEASVKIWDIRKIMGGKGNKKKPVNYAAKIDPWTWRRTQMSHDISTKIYGQDFYKTYDLFNKEEQNRELSVGNSWISLSPNGVSLMVSSLKNVVYVYKNLNTLDIEPPIQLIGHRASFYVKGCFSSQSTHVVSGSLDGPMFIWDTEKPDEPWRVITGHVTETNSVDWSSGSSLFLASTSDDCCVNIWDF